MILKQENAQIIVIDQLLLSTSMEGHCYNMCQGFHES